MNADPTGPTLSGPTPPDPERPAGDVERSAADERDRHARSFRSDMSAYARSRPGYPDAAVDWLVPTGARNVVDLGAGGGQFTRSLLARGLAVTAVEPSPAMRSTLAAALPGVTVLDGSGEALPVADASVDAVFCAQAWHWVDPVAAGAEVVRVLRPGGTLGLVWNLREERTALDRELDALLAPDDASWHRSPDVRADGDTPPDVGPNLVLERGPESRWVQHLPVAGLVDLVASRSYVIVLDEPARARVLAAAAELARRWAEASPTATVDVAYVTSPWRARRS